MSEQCSQNNFPITKINPFKVPKYEKVWWIFRQKWGKIKIFVIILSLLLKIRTKIHITNKTNNALFSGTIYVFSGAFKKLNEQIYK